MRRAVLLIAVLLLAGTAGAVETVLTPESVLYSIEQSGATAQLEIVRRAGDTRETLVVPGTEDEALEAEAQLAFDQASGTLFVAWRHESECDKLLVSMYNGEWSGPVVIAEGGDAHVGVNLVATRVEETTLVHIAWWSGNEPKYALAAFAEGAHVSTAVSDLEILAAAPQAGDVELDDDGQAIHPPMAMAKANDGVDVVFGRAGSTTLTRVRISPKLEPTARIWRPVGRTGGHLPAAKLYSATSDPVRAFISKGRVVLYTPDSQFRFVVFENGRWSPTRMIELDESLSADAVLYELRKTIDSQSGAEDDIVTH